MAVLTWVFIALAIWHFMVFVPDRFLGGIVGAFVAAIVGGILGGLILSGLKIPAQDDVSIATALLAIPGTLIGLAIIWIIGNSREARSAQTSS